MWTSGVTLAVTLTLNFQDQIWNLLYIYHSQKWSNCHETKSKHIDWILGLKCDHRVWPWPWTWTWIFKVNYGICSISAKSGPKVRCKDLPDSDWGDFRCRCAVDSSSFLLNPQEHSWIDFNWNMLIFLKHIWHCCVFCELGGESICLHAHVFVVHHSQELCIQFMFCHALL